MIFDHIGLITTEKQEKEDWVESTRVWVTNPKTHPYKVEWLRYEPDSPVKNAVREKPHIAFQVENIDVASRGMKVLLEPFVVEDFVKVGFFEAPDGVVVEFMQYLKDPNKWFQK
ncbi:MAG: hypothetical protein A2252_06085 [Elusimicrobia bacterium RIFOXYA2_FULL_39_19]|nr:MAG: hypothetical protein A2252_06085 [Elusimicrobia bacterium RIFOXYA2_FULL_39_19]